MSLIKFRSPFLDFFNEFETLGTFKFSHLPAADVTENDNEFEVALSAPGLTKSDFNVKIEDDTLIVSGEKKKSDKKFNLKESFEGTFVRTFRLPKEIKVDEITATYSEGILTIKVPKDTSVIKKKMIEIQ